MVRVRSTAPRPPPRARGALSTICGRAASSTSKRRDRRPRLRRPARCAALRLAPGIRAISAKLCRCGPVTVAVPIAAGSSRLWPPMGCRLPPTKATCAHAVERHQLAQRIDDEHIRIAPAATASGGAWRPSSLLACQVHRRAEALGMARRPQQQQARHRSRRRRCRRRWRPLRPRAYWRRSRPGAWPARSRKSRDEVVEALAAPAMSNFRLPRSAHLFRRAHRVR